MMMKIRTIMTLIIICYVFDDLLNNYDYSDDYAADGDD